MGVESEETIPELKDFQISSWVPVTPAKPSQPAEQLICANRQENFPVQKNWPEPISYTPLITQEKLCGSGRLPEDFLEAAQCRTAPACCSSPNLSNAGRVTKNCQANIVNNPNFNGDGSWATNVSCMDLLAMADAAAGKKAVESAVTNTDFVATSSQSPQFTITFANSCLQLQEKRGLVGANSEARLNIPNDSTDGSFIPCRPLFDLNSPLTTIKDAGSSKSMPSQFQPMTPELNNKVAYRENLARQAQGIDINSPLAAIKDAGSSKSMPSQFQPMTPELNNKVVYWENLPRPAQNIDVASAGKDAQYDKITKGGLMELPENNEEPRLIIDLSFAATSAELQENHKPDKGGTEEANLIKTPQQKPRRKKHRPKVILEGQHKSTKSSAEKTTVPQETTRVKRKYVRRKGVINPQGGSTDGIYLNKPTSTPTGNSIQKRKYERRKKTNQPEAEPDNGTMETADINPRRHTRSSCRRSLNFNPECQVTDESSSYCSSSYCNGALQGENFNAKDQSRNEQWERGVVEMKEKTGMGHSHECRHAMNQVWEDHMEMPAQHVQCSCPSTNESPLMESLFTDQTACTRGKCQIIFSDVTHDKEANIVQMKMNPRDERMPKSLADSICSSSSSTYLNPERQERGLKRHEMASTVVEHCNRNETGAFYNSLQKYLPIFSQNADNSDSALGLHFTAMNKKKRTEIGPYRVTSPTDNYLKFERHTPRDSCTNLLTNSAIDGPQNGKQVYEELLALESMGRAKKRKSKAPTRVRKLASLMEIHNQIPASPGKAATTSGTQKCLEILHERHACFGAHVTDIHTMVTKEWSNRSMIINSTPHYNHEQSSTISMGPPLALPWKCMPSIDTITEQLNQLDLNANNSQGLVAYHTNYQELNALVPFQGSGAVVPFDSSFDQVRRRRPRPKVDLDDETTRVWKLLLENINSEGIDGTDEEKAKWWEEQRSIFRGRADSFIARMHLVQGDRRFSPWKGSVVDSVVGVFLTQNVSDHLSSSAFMSLAAKFPICEKTQPMEFHEEKLGPRIEEPKASKTNPGGALGLNTKISNMLAYGSDTKSLQDVGADSIREVNCVKTSGKNFDGLNTQDNLRSQSEDTSKHSPIISQETVTSKSGSLIDDGRETEDTLSSQNSTSSPIGQTTERSNSCLFSTSEQEPTAEGKPDRLATSTSCEKLLQIVDTVLQGVYERGNNNNAFDLNQKGQSESLAINLENEGYLDNATVHGNPVVSSIKSTQSQVPNLGRLATQCDFSHKTSGTFNSSSKNELFAAETSGLTFESASRTLQKAALGSFQEGAKSCNNDQSEINQTSEAPAESTSQEEIFKMHMVNPVCPETMVDVTGSSSNIDSSRSSEHKEVNSNKNDTNYRTGKPIDEPKGKGVRTRKEKEKVDWDHLRKQAKTSSREKSQTDNMDSVDWEAVRCADVNMIAQTIKERGMNNMLAERIKDFLNRLVRDHGSIDLEWLRDVPPDKAKEYLLSIRGLGLKSVECVRLLTLHHLAFPVDTNVGRIAVRLGWVPLQPLPESLQLHLLELYPVLESIQKFLWPRLCKLDQRTLYELHYQLITFGKVFCTKSKPNCNACPMRAECRHFASAFASARLALPAPGETSIVSTHENRGADLSSMTSINNLQLPPPHMNQINSICGVSNSQPIIEEPLSPEPTVEVPATPEPSYTQASVCDIESAFNEDSEEIPTIQLNMEEFNYTVQKIMQKNNELQEGDMSKALVALTPEAASIPVPKIKNVSRLRTEHQVYELPDSHPLLQRMDKREPDDPCPYLLAIWTPGETVDSIKPPERRCSSQGFEQLCTDKSCLSCNSIREANSQTVRGTLLIPCRTAMRGSFPLNGTYFQVNEVFSDHESSLSPINVPREWLWNLPRRTVYFGTSIPTIFKGLSTEGIQYCFWRGFVCVRGFDRKTRAPRPLIARLHFPASRLGKGKGKIDEDNQ